MMTDQLRFNKIAGAVLTAVLVVVGSNFVTDIIFDDHKPEKPAYVVDVANTGTHDGGSKKAEEVETVDLASGDAAKGQAAAKKCAACHTFDAGGKNKSGPALHGVLGRALAAVDGFSYSNALKEKGGTWTPELLDCFLKKPKKCIPGTKMNFGGLKKPKDRANLIAYLKSLGG